MHEGDDAAAPSRLDGLGDERADSRVTNAHPTDPEIAACYLQRVERLLERLAVLEHADRKRDQFGTVLGPWLDEGRAMLAFTEYLDTRVHRRESLVPISGPRLACRLCPLP